MALAVEPTLALGGPETDELSAGRLDSRHQRRPCAAHWEDSVAVTDEGPWVLTDPVES